MARHAKHEVAPRRRHSSRRSPSRGTVTLRALGVLLATGVALLCLGFFQGERVRDPVLPTVLPDPRPALSEELSPPEQPDRRPAPRARARAKASSRFFMVM